MKKICGAAVLSAITIAALGLSLAGCKNASWKSDPAADGYDSLYEEIIPSKCDAEMRIDGELTEDRWQGKKKFVNYFLEDSGGDMAHIEVVSCASEKGFYIGAVCYDGDIRYSGYMGRNRNTTLELYMTVPGQTIIDVVCVDVEQLYSYNNPAVSQWEYAVKTEGEINSGETEYLSVEIFMPWESLQIQDFDVADAQAQQVLIYPVYRVALAEGGVAQLCTKPWRGDKIDQLFIFDGTGYIGADAADALIGDAPNGYSKQGLWTGLEEIEKDPDESNANVTVYTGEAKTVSGYMNAAYLKTARATNFSFEATVLPYGIPHRDGSADAGLTVTGTTGTMVQLLLNLGDAANTNYRTRSDGKINFSKISAAAVNWNLAANGSIEKTQVYAVDKDPEGDLGVKLKIVKRGAEFFGFVDGVMVWTAEQNRVGGDAYLGFYSARSEVGYTDIRWTNYDGTGGLDRLDAELAQPGVRFADAEVEGEGSVTLDKTAFVSGDSVKLSIVGGENHILADLFINGESVYDDFTANAVIVGTHTEYMIQNATQNIHVKAIFRSYQGVAFSGRLSVEEGDYSFADIVIYAFRSDKSIISFYQAVAENGAYSILLPSGSYDKLYFIDGKYKTFFKTLPNGSDIVIGTDPITNADYTLEMPELNVQNDLDCASDWEYVNEHTYRVTISSSNPSFYTAKYFDASASSGFAGQFIVKFTVSGLPNGQSAGIAFKTNNGNDLFLRIMPDSAQNKVWIGFTRRGQNARDYNIGTRVGSSAYIGEDISVTVVYYEGKLLVILNGQMYEPAVSGNMQEAFDFSQILSENVEMIGLGCYQCKASVLFSDCFYATDTDEIFAAVGRSVRFEELDASDGGISSVSGVYGGKALAGSKISFDVTPAAERTITVKVNGKALESFEEKNGIFTYVYVMSKSDVVISFEVRRGGEVTGTLPSGHSIDQIRAVSDSGTITFGSEVIENDRYRLYLPTGAEYRLYFESATHEGVISNIAPQSAGAVTANLNSMSQKLYGAENGSCSADWQMTQTGTYSVTVSDDTSANCWTGNYFGSAQNFMVKVRIQNLQACGQGGIVFRTDSETAILRIKPENGQAYVGVMAITANQTTGARASLSFDGNDFTITVVRDASGVKFYVNDVLFGNDTYQQYPFSALGNDVKIGLGLYQATGTITFSEYSFVTDEESIAEYIAQHA